MSSVWAGMGAVWLTPAAMNVVWLGAWLAGPVSWFRNGRRDDRSGLRLLSAASFANARAVRFTCQYFLISHSSLDSGVTDGGSNQEGILPNETLVKREEVRKVVGSSISTNTQWPRDAFAYVKITTDECQMPGSNSIEQHQGKGVILLKGVDCKVFNKPSKTNVTKKKISCHYL